MKSVPEGYFCRKRPGLRGIFSFRKKMLQFSRKDHDNKHGKDFSFNIISFYFCVKSKLKSDESCKGNAAVLFSISDHDG